MTIEEKIEGVERRFSEEFGCIIEDGEIFDYLAKLQEDKINEFMMREMLAWENPILVSEALTYMSKKIGHDAAQRNK